MASLPSAFMVICIVATGTAAHAQGSPASAPAVLGSQSVAVASDAVSHAERVERRALGTSFMELEAFGQAAALRSDSEGLSRLQHVTRIVINQGDFASATRWNDLLHLSAERQSSARYLAVAKINALQIRHLRERNVSLGEVASLAGSQTDWLPRVFAQTVHARRIFDEGRIGEALRLMAATIALIPPDQALEASVAAAAWDVVAIGHVMVDDVPGHIKAAERAEAYMAASDYPRPDYESIYNLTQSLSYLGRHDEARAFVNSYARLAARTNTPTSRAYAGNICAFAASSRDDWSGVLQCLEPYGPDLDVPDVVKNAMLPFRATAYARTGQVGPAQRDLDAIRSRIAQKKMSLGGGVQRAEAELLIAQGDFARGVPALREYHLSRFQRTVRSGAAAMEQVVDNMDDQLQTATEQSRLQSEVISSQRLLAAALSVLGAVLAGLAILLARQRRRCRNQAITDTLTGLPNRRYVEKRVNEIVEHAVSRDVRAVVTIIDLDHFKSCNDKFGHDAGDDALRTFAKLVADTIRPGDVFGRWGGEEFLLAVPNASIEEVRPLLQRIAEKAAATEVSLAPQYPLRFSGGAVEVPGSARSFEDVLLASDKLLYAAKAAGRNRIHYAGESLDCVSAHQP